MTSRTSIPCLTRRPLVAALAFAFMVSGCASITTRTQPLPEIAVPAQWSGTASTESATALAQWWQRFNDPLLTQLVTQALQANTTVRSAQAALAQARALRDVQSANMGPNIGASASAQRSKSGDNPAGNNFRAGFDASWEPDIFGGKRAGLSASVAEALTAQASLADTQVSVAAEVAVAYMQLRGSQARLAIARSNLASQQETLQITDWRVQAGLTTSLELSQARTNTEQTLAQIPTLETAIVQTQHALAVLTGQPPNALQAQLDPVAAVPLSPDDLALSIPAQTLRQRPDVRAAEQQIAAALARVSQADAARYPSFNLSGSLGLSAIALSSLTGGASLVTGLLGSVSVPLFDGGAARAQVRSQEAGLEKARVAYQAVVLNALQEVEDALVSLRGNRERLLRLRNASESAQQAALLATQRYNSGLVDFQTVLDTQRSLLSTQDNVASTQAELSADHVRLYKALGGGWQPEPNTGKTP
ncbi:MAG: efflux transporter outer membrane subunit [Cytophagales bacterium]|nr:efflux transporter outer membrane subunit [Rhizobacter sp.]